jgi:hypothetical protein
MMLYSTLSSDFWLTLQRLRFKKDSSPSSLYSASCNQSSYAVDTVHGVGYFCSEVL